MRVRFVDLGSQYRQIKAQALSRLDALCKQGGFILGEELEKFEKEFADYCGVKYAVGVNSGTDALFLALLSLGIGKGDEVIIPAFTFIATAFAVSHTQARPVFVDIDEKTYNINPGQIERAINKRTRAIIPVHLFGQAADMGAILKIAAKYGLKVIEDAAQAHGAEYVRPLSPSAGLPSVAGHKATKSQVEKVGSIGDVGCFSFYPTKNLGAFGDAGIAVTNNKNIYKRLRMLRDCGRSAHNKHIIKGYNSRLDTLQAIILRLKLRHLDKWNRLRRRNAGIYNKLLKDKPGITLPYEAPFARHVFHIYALQINKRRRVIAKFYKKGIGAQVHYPVPVFLQGAYKDLPQGRRSFPVTERICRRIISLPMHPFLKRQEIEFVVNQI